jgi:hypothetical protein
VPLQFAVIGENGMNFRGISHLMTPMTEMTPIRKFIVAG